tara:strand:+ start:229 stop:711 length:483 start_codon:yes stop_codon:yes gene_type:complete
MKKAFSLIEILVVVVILSILSSIGIFVYSGLIESAEERSVKSNCASVKKYIENELSLCAIGKKTVMSGKLNCERYIADDVAVACMDSLASSYPNNFDPEKDRRAGVYTSFFSNSLSNPCNSSDKGRISVRQNNQTDKIIIECCGDTNSDIVQHFLDIKLN